MHPAKSVIFFTVASGAGYGLIALFAIFDLLGFVPRFQAATLSCIGLSLALISAGLISSTFHLGHPERAWRALTQWRSSWLSREGVAALATYAPILVYGFLRWRSPETVGDLERAAAGLSIIGAVVTVYCTSMIYASLKTLPAWATPWTPICYLALAAASGGILFSALAHMGGFYFNLVQWVALSLIALGFFTKFAYRREVFRKPPVSTAESATGLAKAGESAHLLEGPHTEANYLTEEMDHRVAPPAVRRMLRISMMWGFLYPFLAILFATSDQTWVNHVMFGIAILTAAIGITAERWLFFAEAKHTVSLYYGTRAV